MLTIVRGLFELCGSAIAPDRCAACDAPVPVLTAFCPTCAATLTRAAYRGPRDLSPFLYGGAIARAIARFKYERHPELARPLSSALRRAVRNMQSVANVVVPVPLFPARLVERGYNQAALLAQPVAVELGAGFEPTALVRTRDTGQQAKLEQAARAANVDGAFVVRCATDVRGQHVLLVDDVRTTGATLRACAAALREASATEVTTLVVARVDSEV